MKCRHCHLPIQMGPKYWIHVPATDKNFPLHSCRSTLRLGGQRTDVVPWDALAAPLETEAADWYETEYRHIIRLLDS